MVICTLNVINKCIEFIILIAHVHNNTTHPLDNLVDIKQLSRKWLILREK